MFRKNPVHFREYSHDFAAAADGSGSEGEGSVKEEEDVQKDESRRKPVCPYGANCYRQNPAHRREYAHPKEGKDKKSLLRYS